MANGTLEERSIQYLSVYDIVWINTTLTGKALKFDYVTLEEAMAAQYSYGVSTNVSVQAANLLQMLVLKRPFEYGNVRTGFIAVTAFLTANGYALKVDDEAAASMVRQLASHEIGATEAIEALAKPADTASPWTQRPGYTLRTVVTHIFNARTKAIQTLAPGDD